jgi:hypothetical protein
MLLTFSSPGAESNSVEGARSLESLGVLLERAALLFQPRVSQIKQ